MGYYIQTPCNLGKADYIAREYGGINLTTAPPWKEIPKNKALIAVVNCGPYEAAGFAFDEEEYNVFTDPNDKRPKRYVLMDRDKAIELTDYKE